MAAQHRDTPPAQRRLISPYYWPAWFAVALVRLLLLLPFGIQTLIGRGLGRLAWHIAHKERRVGDINLRLCMPELSAEERTQLLQRHFEFLGCGIFDTAMSWWGRRGRVMKLTHMEGMEHLEHALTGGKGAIMLSAHFTATEMGARALGLRVPAAVMYQQLGNAVIEAQFRSSCGAREVQMIRSDSVRELLQALKRNTAVWFAPDQREAMRSATLAPFFGIPVVTNTATSRIARISGAPVLPYFTERLEDGSGYRFLIGPPIENFPSEDEVADAVRFHHLLEAQVRRCPAQYLWTYKRFRRPGPDGDPYRREPPKS